ncbi:MAG: beta(1,3)galactosyltransferase EpsH [Blautia sp.]|nr:beta(1,3)galactosyltransferase EpsH [Blautia sp.]
MIFVTVGSQKFQFNRLLEKLDRMIEEERIHEPVFAQTGYSDYKPRHYEFQPFLSKEEFDAHIQEADIVLTHGGTGVIVGSVKKGKKVIAVPRLERFGEHVDDHQTQIVELFKEAGLIYGCTDCTELEEAFGKIRDLSFKPYESNTQRILDSIDSFISSCF